MTSRVNQDCLENFFSVIRQASGCRDIPNAEQFGQAFRQCAVKSLLVAPNTANCTIDTDVFLASLADLSGSQTIQTQAGSSEELDMTCETEKLTGQTQLNIVPEQLADIQTDYTDENIICLLYTSPSPRDRQKSRMPSSA